MKDQSGLNLVYIKLGGSLITDKRQAETPRHDVIERLAAEIAAARNADPSLRLIIGHGSGSFGHVVGSRYGTRSGVYTSEQWYGFAATADAAARLSRIVTAALLAADLPVWSIQPSVALRCEDGVIVDGPAETVRLALERGLIPLVHGDVALDAVRGGTIASTEEIFEWLAETLPPRRMVLAGEVDGVYTGDPLRDPAARLIPEITPQRFAVMEASLGSSFGTDVTGGMAAKVAQSLRLAQRHPHLRILICSGLIPGAVQQSLTAAEALPGTVIYS
jgi:isopentenyl phosphate kinase